MRCREPFQSGQQTGGARLLQTRDPAVVDLVTQRLQSVGESREECAAKIPGEFPPPLSDVTRPDVLVAKARKAAKQAVFPETPVGDLLLPLIEPKEGGDPAPMPERRVLPQILVAGLEAVRPAIAPVQQVAQ